MEQCLYKIRRRGAFKANLHPLNQCGKEGQRDFNFAIEVSANSLDERDFVIDNLLLLKTMQQWDTAASWTASCEQLAGGAVLAVHKLMDGRAREIRARIEPNDQANVELYWREGFALPTVIPQPTVKREEWRLPALTKYEGKTLEEVPEGYVLFLDRARPTWANLEAVHRRIEELTVLYGKENTPAAATANRVRRETRKPFDATRE
jgi:hypothetical protein